MSYKQVQKRESDKPDAGTPSELSEMLKNNISFERAKQQQMHSLKLRKKQMNSDGSAKMKHAVNLNKELKNTRKKQKFLEANKLDEIQEQESEESNSPKTEKRIDFSQVVQPVEPNNPEADLESLIDVTSEGSNLSAFSENPGLAIFFDQRSTKSDLC